MKVEGSGVKKKKLAAVLLTVILFVAYMIPGAAATRHYTPCPEEGKHMMQGRGVGRAEINETPLFTGFCSQCINCYLAIVSERNPYYYWVDSLGRYVLGNPHYTLGNTGTVMNASTYYTNTSLTDPNDPFVNGMEFIS